MSVLGVEASVVYEVDAAADDVASGERRAVRLSGARGAERVTVVSVITVRVFIPTCSTTKYLNLEFDSKKIYETLYCDTP